MTRNQQLSASAYDAVRLTAEHERRMAALDAFLAAHEAEHGVITDAEIDEAVRRADGRAVAFDSKEGGRFL